MLKNKNVNYICRGCGSDTSSVDVWECLCRLVFSEDILEVWTDDVNIEIVGIGTFRLPICDSCHALYRSSEVLDIKSQGEIFCHSCYIEWTHYREEERNDLLQQ
jgi:hypothetical protein